MIKKLFVLLYFIFFIFTIKVNGESKVLLNYVNRFDPIFSWTLNVTHDIGYAKVYVLEFISQQWLTYNESDSSIWKHWLQICVPKNYDPLNQVGILYVDGGRVQNWKVPGINDLSNFGKLLCSAGNQITATLQQSPNQDVIFYNDGILREEDDIVAYAWIKFLNTNNSDWISLNPQTKSAVRAMDAIQQFGQTITGNYNLTQFIVTGGSKRGWTTWGVSMVNDLRVVGIAPMVIGILNMVENIEVQMEYYGNWSFALKDYIDHGVPEWLYTPYFKLLTDVIDPINYIDVHSRIPKLILFGTADEFFIPDSTKYYFNKLKGEKKIQIFPNTNHNGIKKQEVANSIVNFYNLISQNIQFPQFNWTIQYSNDKNTSTITLNIQSGVVTKVQLWSATTISTTRRDFRYVTCKQTQCYQNIQFLAINLQESSPNTFIYSLSAPNQGGWTGFYMNVHFSTGSVYSTEMAVVPDIVPFQKCPMSACGIGAPNYISNQTNFN